MPIIKQDKARYLLAEAGWSQPYGSGLFHGLDGAVYDLRDWGAVYREPKAAEANRVAWDAFCADLPDTGGVLFVDDWLFIKGPLDFPFFTISTNRFVKPLSIVGANAGRSAIINTADSYAVRFRAGTVPRDGSFPATSYTAHWQRIAHCSLERLAITSRGGGVAVAGGGKSLVLRDLLISRCAGIGLRIGETDEATYDARGTWYSSGFVQNVQCIENDAAGARIEQVTATRFDGLTCRGNKGNGLELRDCTGVDVVGTCEANAGLGFTALRLEVCDVNVWTEGNAGNTYTAQYEIRKCVSSRFARWRPWHSTIGNATVDQPSERLCPAQCDLPDVPGDELAVYDDRCAIANSNLGDKLAITIRPGRFPSKRIVDIEVRPGAHAITSAQWSCELFRTPGLATGLNSARYSQGDAFVCELELELDSAAVSYFRSLVDARQPLHTIRLAPNIPGADSLRIHCCDPGVRTYRTIWTATKPQVDPLRLFLWIAQPGAITGPDAPYRIRLHNISVRRV